MQKTSPDIPASAPDFKTLATMVDADIPVDAVSREAINALLSDDEASKAIAEHIISDFDLVFSE